MGVETARSEKFDLQSEVQHFEAELIRSALIMTGGRQRRAAKLLGMKVTTLHSKIRRYGLHDTANGDVTSGHEPSAAEAVRTSLELVEAMFETEQNSHRRISGDSRHRRELKNGSATSDARQVYDLPSLRFSFPWVSDLARS